MNWVVVASYSYPYEAQIAKARLVSAEIPVYLENEHTINMNWLYAHAMGDVGVCVPEHCLQQAQYLLNTDFTSDLEEELKLKAPQCPSCQSQHIQAYTQGKKVAFTMFAILGFSLFKYKQGYQCLDCLHFFETPKI